MVRSDRCMLRMPVTNAQYTASRGVYFVVTSEPKSQVQRLGGVGTVKRILDLPFIPSLGLLVTKPDETGTDLMLVEGFRRTRPDWLSQISTHLIELDLTATAPTHPSSRPM